MDERYDRILTSAGEFTLTQDDITYVESILFDKIERGEMLDQAELQWMMDYDRVDTEIVEVGRHGWVEMRTIYKIRGKFYEMTFFENDIAGTEFDDQILYEVEPQEVIRTDYVRKN